MAEILKEKVTNRDGVVWIRTHGMQPEDGAFCSHAIHTETEGVEEGVGQITCPDCIQVITYCKGIPDSDLTPEYENDMFSKRFNR